MKIVFQAYENLFSALCKHTAVKDVSPPENILSSTVTISHTRHAYKAYYHLYNAIRER